MIRSILLAMVVGIWIPVHCVDTMTYDVLARYL